VTISRGDPAGLILAALINREPDHGRHNAAGGTARPRSGAAINMSR
jgi:hypothetical protein